MIGFQTLFYKEILRFWKVATQTITAPILTALLYLMIFGHVLDKHVQVYAGVQYTAFLIPGLVMMSVLQNAFANSSSSLMQSKITGNLVFILLPPLSYWELFSAYVLAAIVRGLVVGLGVFIFTVWFADLSFQAPVWIILFSLLGAAILGTMGLIAGIWIVSLTPASQSGDRRLFPPPSAPAPARRRIPSAAASRRPDP